MRSPTPPEAAYWLPSRSGLPLLRAKSQPEQEVERRAIGTGTGALLTLGEVSRYPSFTGEEPGIQRA